MHMTRIQTSFSSALCLYSTRRLTPLAVAGLMVGSFASTAQAGGFFDFLFGGGQRQAAAPIHAYADPSADGRGERDVRSERTETPGTSGGRKTFCVRLCDGRFFPMMSAGNATPVQTCSAMCPAAKTKVFYGGGEIASATDASGARYTSLDQAFAYRKALVPACTCNGKDAFGLAPLDVMTDPTLRPGDIVATQDGLKAFEGGKRDAHKAADFTPAQNSPRVSGSVRDRLSTLRVSEKQ
jgi:hypothetical protein